MICETYERNLAGQEPLSDEVRRHAEQCEGCSRFAHALEAAQAGVRTLESPSLPPDFASRLATRAVQQKALQPQPWWQKWLTPASNDGGWRTTFALAGFSMAWAGVAAGSSYGTTLKFYDASERPGMMAQLKDPLHWFAWSPWTSEHPAQVAAAFALIVLVLGLRASGWAPLMARLRQGERVSPGPVLAMCGGGLLLLLLSGWVATLGFCALDNSWRGPAFMAEKSLPGSLVLVAGWFLVLATICASYDAERLCLVPQGLVFYGGLGVLYGLFDVSQRWEDVVGTINWWSPTYFRLLSPFETAGAMALAVGSIALLAGMMLGNRGVSRRTWPVVLVALLGLLPFTHQTWLFTRQWVGPLTPRGKTTMTLVALGTIQGRLEPVQDTEPEFDTAENRDPLQRLAEESQEPLRSQAIDRLAQMAREHWDRPRIQSLIIGSVKTDRGLAANLNDWDSPWLTRVELGKLLPPGSYSPWIRVRGRLLVNGKPGANLGIGLRQFYVGEQEPLTESLQESLLKKAIPDEIGMRRKTATELTSPSTLPGLRRRWDEPSLRDNPFVVTDANGTFAFDDLYTGCWVPVVQLPEGTTIRTGHNLPNVIRISSSFKHKEVDLGTIELGR